jgi:hypothetical protein
MYDFLPEAADVRILGGVQRFFRLLRVEAARLVLKLRAGARRAARPSALGGRIKGLKGQKGEEAGMPLGVVAGRAWCCKLAGCYFCLFQDAKNLFDTQDRGRGCAWRCVSTAAAAESGMGLVWA